MSGELQLHEDDEDTEALLRDARRPQLIRTHRPLIEEIDTGLSDALVMGTSDNPRLRQILEELATDGERARIESSLRELSTGAGENTVRHALLDHMSLLRAEKGLEFARLQIHAIGIYRRLIELMHQRQGVCPSIDDIRQLPSGVMPRLLVGRQAIFGDADLRDDLVATPGVVAATRGSLERLLKPARADVRWDDVEGAPTLPDRIAGPLRAMPAENREAALRLAEQDLIRSRFFRQVFIDWFAADSLDPDQSGYRTVLEWLLAVEETPHLFPFMQGQSNEQKSWRLVRLVDKILQLHEIYARVGHYAKHDEWRAQLANLDTRARLAVIGKARLPGLPLTRDVAVAIMLVPFAQLARWIQDKVANKDFVLPPERR